MQYMYKTKYALLYHASNVEEVHVYMYIKATLKGKLSSIMASSDGRGLDYKFKGCEFKSHCGQD